MRELILQDGHYYEIKNIFDKIGTENYYVNDKILMPSSTKQATEENMILEIYDAMSPYFIPRRIEDSDPNFIIKSDKGDIKELFEGEKSPNIALLYLKKIDSFIEPLSKAIIRRVESSNKTIKYLEEETYKSLKISPVVYESSTVDNIMEIRKEDVKKADNEKYRELLSKYFKRAKIKFNERYSKYIGVEYIIAQMQNETYDIESKTRKKV